MLILTRRCGENILIGQDIVVTVLGVKGNQVRIGVQAPKDVSVNREEVAERIAKERQTLQSRPTRLAQEQNDKQLREAIANGAGRGRLV